MEISEKVLLQSGSSLYKVATRIQAKPFTDSFYGAVEINDDAQVIESRIRSIRVLLFRFRTEEEKQSFLSSAFALCGSGETTLKLSHWSRSVNQVAAQDAPRRLLSRTRSLLNTGMAMKSRSISSLGLKKTLSIKKAKSSQLAPASVS